MGGFPFNYFPNLRKNHVMGVFLFLVNLIYLAFLSFFWEFYGSPALVQGQGQGWGDGQGMGSGWGFEIGATSIGVRGRSVGMGFQNFDRKYGIGGLYRGYRETNGVAIWRMELVGSSVEMWYLSFHTLFFLRI